MKVVGLQCRDLVKCAVIHKLCLNISDLCTHSLLFILFGGIYLLLHFIKMTKYLAKWTVPESVSLEYKIP